MADWADVATYQEMIDGLGQFCTDVNQACETMLAAGQTCANNLSNDVTSLKACKQLALSIKGYEEAVEKAQALAKALSEERDNIARMLQEMESE